MKTTRPNEFVPGRPSTVVRDGIAFQVTPSPAYLPFWNEMASSTWEPHTMAVLKRFLRDDKTMLDVGAWIGPTTLFGAHLAREVIALEPDPVAFNELAGNIALNRDVSSRITILKACLAPTTGPVALYSGGFYHKEQSAFGDSMSSLLSSPESTDQNSVDAQGVSIDDIEKGYDCASLGFIKMDVEGGEYLLLPVLRDFLATYRPTVFVSFHVPPSDYLDSMISESFATLADLYPNIYTASGSALPLADVLAEGTSWREMSADDPASLLLAVARQGIVATFETW